MSRSGAPAGWTEAGGSHVSVHVNCNLYFTILVLTAVFTTPSQKVLLIGLPEEAISSRLNPAGTIPWISLMVFTHILMLLTLSEMCCMNHIADTVSPAWLQLLRRVKHPGRRDGESPAAGSYNMPEHSQRFDFFWFPWILVTHIGTVSTCLFFFYWCKFKMHHFLWRRVFPRKHADVFHII